MESSVGWTISDDGGWGGSVGGGGSGSIVSFDNSGEGPRRGGDGGDDATARAAAPAPIERYPHSMTSTSASESNKSIFELSRRYIGLALCSSGRGVVPVHLGRAIVAATSPPQAYLQANQNGSLTRPSPPPRAVTGNTPNAGVARRISPRTASATIAMVSQVGRRRHRRRRSFAPASPTPGAGGGGSGAGGGGTAAAAACAGGGGSFSKVPTENNRPRLGKEPIPGPTLQRSPSPNGAGVYVADTRGDTDQDAGSVVDGCSRGRRCGASPKFDVWASSERLGLGRGADIGSTLAKYHPLETYNCPVSPFSIPPSWADIPPLAMVEPPGYPPQNNTPVVEEAERGGGEGDDSCASLQLEDGTRKTSVARPVEKTTFQKIAGRRASFGWGWKRPSGDQGRQRTRQGLSPRERKLWGGPDVRSEFPPTS